MVMTCGLKWVNIVPRQVSSIMEIFVLFGVVINNGKKQNRNMD